MACACDCRRGLDPGGRGRGDCLHVAPQGDQVASEAKKMSSPPAPSQGEESDLPKSAFNPAAAPSAPPKTPESPVKPPEPPVKPVEPAVEPPETPAQPPVQAEWLEIKPAADPEAKLAVPHRNRSLRRRRNRSWRRRSWPYRRRTSSRRSKARPEPSSRPNSPRPRRPKQGLSCGKTGGASGQVRQRRIVALCAVQVGRRGIRGLRQPWQSD